MSDHRENDPSQPPAPQPDDAWRPADASQPDGTPRTPESAAPPQDGQDQPTTEMPAAPTAESPSSPSQSTTELPAFPSAPTTEMPAASDGRPSAPAGGEPPSTPPPSTYSHAYGPSDAGATWSSRPGGAPASGAPQNPWAAPPAGPSTPGPWPRQEPHPQPGYGAYASGQPGAAPQQPGAAPQQPAGQQPWAGAQPASPAPGQPQFQQAGAPWSPATPTTTRSRKSGPHGAPGWLALVVAMVVTALIAVGGTYALVGGRESASSSEGSSSSSTTAQTPQVTQSGEAVDWQSVSSAVGPATVTITVASSSSEEIGSGVVYDADGHIVTNYHVISSAAGQNASNAQITVTMSDSTLYQASVVGYDQTTDLAVLQLENPPSSLTVARFGSSSDLAVGQPVMAIGSPLGLSATVTTGIISALDRPVEVAREDESQQQQQVDPNDPFGQLWGNQGQTQTQAANSSVITNAIQVDASINPGNSGGPLFDASGAVIGINSSIASMSDSSSSSQAGSIGLGFAIPANLVVSVADQLIKSGTVDHAVLGVTIQPGSATVDGTTTLGAEIASVTQDGAAAQAGLKQGDIILSIDGHAVTSPKALSGYVRTYTGGAQVSVEYARDGKTQTVDVTLQSQKS